MDDDFDPNVPCPNYNQRLKEHYEKIKIKLQIPKVIPGGRNRVAFDLMSIVDAKPPPNFLVTKTVLEVVLTEDDKERIKEGRLSTIDKDGARRAPAYFLEKICKAYDTTVAEIQGPTRTKELFRLRANIVQTLFVMYPKNLSLHQIGDLLRRDHSSIFNLKALFSIKEDETLKNYSNIKFDKNISNLRNRKAKKTETTPHV